MRGWWALLRRRRRSSASFFRAAKGLEEEKDSTQSTPRTESSRRKKRDGNSRTLMAESENRVSEPGSDGPIELAEFAGKEVIDTIDHNEAVVTGQRADEGFDFFDRAVLVVASVGQQLGLVARAQE